MAIKYHWTQKNILFARLLRDLLIPGSDYIFYLFLTKISILDSLHFPFRLGQIFLYAYIFFPHSLLTEVSACWNTWTHLWLACCLNNDPDFWCLQTAPPLPADLSYLVPRKPHELLYPVANIILNSSVIIASLLCFKTWNNYSRVLFFNVPLCHMPHFSYSQLV